MNASAVDTTVVRKVDSFDEMEQCVRLQQAVWQFPDIDVIPRRMFAVARSVGGQIFGAWDGDRLVGFALAIPGIRNGRPYLHSHMVAVAPDYRSHGIGMRLKFAQRDDALTRGIDLIEWTFDPSQVRNAKLNIEKLGVIVRRYTENFYGISNSPLHRSLPTDRLHAEWWLNSIRVRNRAAGKPLPQYEILASISVPDPSKMQDRESALESLLRVRQQFQEAFSKKLAVLGFESPTSQDSRYLLGVWNEAEGGVASPSK